MIRKRLGLGLFALGTLFVHTIVTLAFVLSLAGLSLPFMPYSTASGAGPESVIFGCLVPSGVILMVTGGLVYKQEGMR
jgi:hypothetical protein